MSKQPSLLRVKPTVVLPKMNRTEAAYAVYLELLRHAGEFFSWRFEPWKFRLADNTWYKPDFVIRHYDGHIEIVELKGFLRSRDNVRFKVARDLNPEFEWRMVTREGSLHTGRWVDWADRQRPKKQGVGR